jgi:hypothetical protein
MRFIFATLFLITSTAQAGTVAHYATHIMNADTTVSASDITPQSDEAHHWWVIRDEYRVEFRSGDGETSEIWMKESDGFSLIRVFRPSQRAVHYTPSDLRALNVKPDWPALRRLEEPGTEVLAWDDNSGLPAKRKKHRGSSTFIDTMKETWPMAGAPQQPTDLSQLYVMDFSDLGDNEADPFFRQFIHMGPVQHHHAH